MIRPAAPRTDLLVGHWMLLADAARYADVSVDTLQAAIADGRLAARSVHHLGHDTWAVHSRHLEAWAAGRAASGRR